ncbi:MAG: hypothetical protein V2A62_02000 [Candidatus Woesearchaeota archaeon]
MTNHFENILIWALPASGKSEVMTFLKGLTPRERTNLHFGKFVGIDDYPRVASYFEIDDEREANGRSRRDTRRQTYEDGGFLKATTWDDLDQNLNSQYDKLLLRTPHLHETSTMMIECSRGGAAEEGFPLRHGYYNTLKNLSRGILEKAVILYIKVTPEESRRKNDERYDPKDPHGILSHRVPTKVMLNDYGCDDLEWMMSQAERAGYVRTSSGLSIPVGVLDNQNDLTSFVREKGLGEGERLHKTDLLYRALANVLHPLFERYQAR